MRYSILLHLLIFLWACESPNTLEEASADPIDSISQVAILVFLAEQQAEIWAIDDEQKQKLHQTKIQCSQQIPIGIFNWHSKAKEKQGLIFPNDFYRDKTPQSLDQSDYYQLMISYLDKLSQSLQQLNYDKSIPIKTVVIFPNDARGKLQFEAMPSPHYWIGEYHPILLRALKEYQ